MINNTSLEILAPCGSYDILVAAVNAGADACYIGGNKFGARAFAENLGADSIYKAIDYAHLHGTKLYLTVNTLFKQNELKEVYDYLVPYYEAGIDAVIVQDLGGFFMIKKHFPDLDIHCSTQMNINSIHSAKMMKEQGATRIVTAREMSLEEIAAIKKSVDIEVETFVHGAMCYSYSGQCLLSAVAGERSGNRGRCAQPCRKCYDKQYLLSMKDMCSLEILPEIINAGVDSLKIEGRMKNAYYVASCVDAYKEISIDCLNGKFSLDKALQLKEKLANIYNRGGFCQGYFHATNGPHMISIDRANNCGVFVGKVIAINSGRLQIQLDKDIYKQDVFEVMLKDGTIIEITSAVEGKAGQKVWLNCPKTKLVVNNSKIRRTRCNYIIDDISKKIIDNEKSNISLKVKFYGKINEPLRLEAKVLSGDFSFSVSALSKLFAQESKNRPVCKEEIGEKLCQNNNSNIEIIKIDYDISDKLFFPIGEIKKLRRELIEKIEEKVAIHYRKNVNNVLPYDKIVDNKDEYASDKARLNIYVSKYEQLETAIQYENINSICISKTLYFSAQDRKLIKLIREKNIKIYIALPYLINAEFDVKKHLNKIAYDGICIRNIDGLACVKELIDREKNFDKDIICSNSLYCYNDNACFFINSILDKKAIIESPAELKINETKKVNINNLELTTYTHQRVMLSRQCIQKTKYSCNKNNTCNRIMDDNGNSFYALSNCEECCNLIYNGTAFCIFDKLKQTEIFKLNAAYHKIEFTFEDKNSVKKVLDNYFNAIKGNEIILDNKTYGHMYRGVE